MAPVTLEPLESRQMMAFGKFDFAIGNHIVFNQLFPFMINGTPGNDTITVSYTNNKVLGPRVTYQVNGQPAVVAFPAAGQAIEVHGLAGNDYIRASGSGISILGEDGNDRLIGGASNEFIYGQNGLDTIDGGLGADYISGGNDTDTVDYSLRTINVFVGLEGFNNDGQAGELDDVRPDIEVVLGGAGADYITASNQTGYHKFVGNAGDDMIFGSNGPDILIGSNGNDKMWGLEGDDYMIGEYGNDIMRGGGGRDLVSGGYNNDVVYGDAGMDTVYGDQGNDRLYGGADADLYYGGENEDILVAIGGGQNDVLKGDAGFDSFWLDSEATEKVTDLSIAESFMNIHRIKGFMPLNVANQYKETPSRELNGQAIVDPLLEGNYVYGNFGNKQLFGPAGPRPDDIRQGELGDCYFMAPLSALAKTKPNLIKQLVVDLGDGTFAVNMQKNNIDSFIRVDGDIPVYNDGSRKPSFAGFGTQDSMWVAVMEKAYAFFRTNFGGYGSIGNGGQPTEPMYHLGVTSTVHNPTVPQEMINVITQMLNNGRAVMVGTKGGVPNLVERHVYMVESVTWGGTDYNVKLRNPWGYDGPGADSVNDGYVTITGTQLFNSLHSTNAITYSN